MFQAVVGFSLRHRIFVLVVAALLVAWGTMLVREMPIDPPPAARQPSVMLIVNDVPGLAAEEVEHFVTAPQEMALHGMPGVVAVRSRSANSVFYVQAVFRLGTDPRRDRQLVAERLQIRT